MVHIKQLIPQADVTDVVAKRPSLLCMEVRHLVLFRVAPSKPHACRYKLELQVPPVLCVAACLQRWNALHITRAPVARSYSGSQSFICTCAR